jgi:hypothetical protein
MTDPVLEVAHLVKQYDTFRAVDDLSFAVQPGEPLTTTPTIAKARVSIWLSRAAGTALRNDAPVLSYNGEVGMRFLLILITVLALLIIADGGVMRTSLCQVTPFEPDGVSPLEYPRFDAIPDLVEYVYLAIPQCEDCAPDGKTPIIHREEPPAFPNQPADWISEGPWVSPR